MNTLETTTQWNPIDGSESYPKALGVYWVTVDDDSVDEPTTFESYWDGEDFVTNDSYRADIGTVTAWMIHTKPEPMAT